MAGADYKAAKPTCTQTHLHPKLPAPTMVLPLRLLLAALLVALALGAPSEQGLIFNLVIGEHISPPFSIHFGVPQDREKNSFADGETEGEGVQWVCGAAEENAAVWGQLGFVGGVGFWV